MIHEVDQMLSSLLAAELEKSKSLPKGIAISFLSPDEAKDAKKSTVNLFLHDLKENVMLRDESIHVRPTGEDSVVAKRFGPIRLDLSYLITVQGAKDHVEEHQILAELVNIFMRCQVVPEKYLSPDLKEESPKVYVQVAQPEHPVHTDPSQLWLAIGGKLRPGVGLTVTVQTNPYEPKSVRRVREAVMALRMGAPESSAGFVENVSGIHVSIAGVVIDSADSPVEGADVRIVGLGFEATTDSRGLFFFTDLPQRKYTVHVEKRGFAPVEGSAMSPPFGRPDLLEPMLLTLTSLDEARRLEAEKALARQGKLVDSGRRAFTTIVGQLKYEGGEPVAYAVVQLGDQTTVTDSEGYYRFVASIDDRTKSIVARLPGVGDVVVNSSDAGAVSVVGSKPGS